MLPPDLRKPSFIRRYLSGSDFKLLLAGYGVKIIKHKDVLYYFYHYPTTNLELHKYYNVQEYVDAIDVEDNWELIKFHHLNGANLDDFVSIYFIDDIEKVRYLHENDCGICPVALRDSIIYGDMEIIQYLHDNGYKYDRTSFTGMLETRRELVVRGSFSYISYIYDPVVTFLFENITLPNYDSIFMMAVIYCDYYVIKRILDCNLVKLDFDYSPIAESNFDGAGKCHMNHLKKYHGIDEKKFLELL